MKLQQILDGVESLEMVMPEFQREYVWRKDQAKNLMLSMFKEYPTGCLLFWETNTPPEIKNAAVDTERLGLTKVILDGQQRLTTLYMLLRGEIPPYYTIEDIQNDPRNLCFNLLTGEFLFYKKTLMSGDPCWCKVTECFDPDKVDAFDITQTYTEAKEGADFKATMQTISRNLQTLRSIKERDYPILTVPKSATIDEAIDVFDNVNSEGTKLTAAELVLTHVVGRWPQARRVMKDKMADFKDRGFDFTLDQLTRMLVITLTDSALFSENTKLKYDSFTKEDYQGAWTKVSKALDYLIPILKQDAYITSTDDLSTNNVLIPMVAYLVKNDTRFSTQLKYRFIKWMMLALMWARYSGQTEQRLDKDVNIVYNTPDDFIDELIKQIEDQRGRIEVKASDLEGRVAGHPLYRILYIITKAHKAEDWSKGGPIHDTIGDHNSIQSHHVFPINYLYNNGYNGHNHMHRKTVNEIANRVFITRDTNYGISDKAPVEYFPGVLEAYPNALRQQFIPDNERLWTAERYEDFLAERRELIANAINDYLKNLQAKSENLKSANGKASAMNWSEYVRREEDYWMEKKSSLRICLRQDKPMEYIEHGIVKTINAFLNTEGGTLLIGVSDEGEVLGLEKDFASFGNKGKDGFLLHYDNLIDKSIGKEQHAHLDLKFIEVEGKEVAVVKVDPSNKPVYLRRGKDLEFYVRNAASSRAYNMMEANEYINKHWSR